MTPIIVSTEDSAITERHVIGTFSTGGRFTPLLDVNDGLNIRVRDFQVTPYEEVPIYPAPTRRFGGSRQAGEVHGNGSLTVAWILRDETADEVLGQWDALAALLESSRADLYYMWRPGAASQPSYFQLRGGLPAQWDYVWWQFNQRILQLSAGFQVAPLAYGDPMDILDDFSEDTLADDYTFDTGSGTLSVSGGQLVPSSTAEKTLTHTARGYDYNDVQATVKYTTGASVAASWESGVVLKALDDGSYLFAVAYGVDTFGIFIRSGGSTSTLTAGASVVHAVNTSYWLRARIEGNVVTVEHWTSEPVPGGTPAASLTTTLSGANLAYGAGVGGKTGMRLIPKGTDWRYDEFRVEPYTFAVGASPTKAAHDFTLYGVPGTAPAEVAIDTATTGEAYGSIIGWSSKAVENYVWNGHFDNSTITTAGWATAAVAGVTGAATSITRVTTASKYGAASGEVVCPGTSGTGVNFPMYRRFKKGVTYTAVGWMQSAAHTTAVKLRLGVSGDQADSTAVALTTSFVQHTATWTPTADRDVAYVAAIINAATGTTFRLDGIMVYEGITAPTEGFQSEGRGATAPFGLIEAEGYKQQIASDASMTLTADATASGGQCMKATAPTNDDNWRFYHRVAPDLLTADEFSTGVTVEFWVRYKQTSSAYNPTFRMRALPTSEVRALSAFIESDVGTRMVVADHTEWRLARAGAITFPVDALTRAPWEVETTITMPASGAAGDLSFDYLFAVPARQRVAGRAVVIASSDNPGSLYITSDLTTYRRDYPGPHTVRIASPGGQRIEFDPGTVSVAHKFAADSLSEDTDDDGTVPAPTGQVVHFAIWPRFHITRSS